MNMHCSVLAEAWKDLLTNHFLGRDSKKSTPCTKTDSMALHGDRFFNVCYSLHSNTLPMVSVGHT